VSETWEESAYGDQRIVPRGTQRLRPAGEAAGQLAAEMARPVNGGDFAVGFHLACRSRPQRAGVVPA